MDLKHQFIPNSKAKNQNIDMKKNQVNFRINFQISLREKSLKVHYFLILVEKLINARNKISQRFMKNKKFPLSTVLLGKQSSILIDLFFILVLLNILSYINHFISKFLVFVDLYIKLSIYSLNEHQLMISSSYEVT